MWKMAITNRNFVASDLPANWQSHNPQQGHWTPSIGVGNEWWSTFFFLRVIAQLFCLLKEFSASALRLATSSDQDCLKGVVKQMNLGTIWRWQDINGNCSVISQWQLLAEKNATFYPLHLNFLFTILLVQYGPNVGPYFWYFCPSYYSVVFGGWI